MPHLAIPCGEDSPQDLPILLHLLKLAFQGTLHMCIGQHVLHHIFLQGAPEGSLVAVVKLEPAD